MIRLSRSIVGQEEASAVARVIERGFLGMGVEVEAFEAELAEYVGGEVGVVCVSSGTAALHLALSACGVGRGDFVLVPSLTFVATFQAIGACGAVPLICDVRREDGLLDLEDAKRRMRDGVKAVVPVHYASSASGLDEVYEFAGSMGIRVVEDAAHAFGNRWRGVPMGQLGDVVCFSFDGIKNITSGEGGAVVTRDAGVLASVRRARVLGIEKAGGLDVREQGWRYHMSDMMAAVGRVQLGRLESEFAPARRRLAAAYHEGLEGVGAIRCLVPRGCETPEQVIVPHIFPVCVSGGLRDKVSEGLGASEIETGFHYVPGHRLSLYADGEGRAGADALAGELVTLPLHPGLSFSDVAIICGRIREVIGA